MGYGWGAMGQGNFFGSLFGILVLVFLVLGIAYFWKGLNNKK